MSHNQSELDNDTVLMHKIDEILYGEHEKPYSTGDALLMLIRNQIAQHESSARIDELEKFVNTTNRSISVKKLRDRLSALKSQQEEHVQLHD